MIINLWVLAVLVELVLLASVGLVWALRTRVVLVTAPPLDEGSVRPPTAPPSPPPKPKTPVPEEGPRRSFWEASQAALAEGSTALSVPDVPAPPPIEEPKLVALEPQVVLQAMPIYLEESDVEAALASAGAGFGADDLMQLQDVVSSTEAKLKREAKALDGLVKRLTAEAEQLTAAAAVLTPLLGGSWPRTCAPAWPRPRPRWGPRRPPSKSAPLICRICRTPWVPWPRACRATRRRSGSRACPRPRASTSASAASSSAPPADDPSRPGPWRGPHRVMVAVVVPQLPAASTRRRRTTYAPGPPTSAGEASVKRVVGLSPTLSSTATPSRV